MDNTGALSNLIHGYASRPDCGRLVNALHLALAALQMQTWFEWVPSKENVADVPSREDSDLELIEILEGAGLEGAFDEVEFVFPPIQGYRRGRRRSASSPPCRERGMVGSRGVCVWGVVSAACAERGG